MTVIAAPTDPGLATVWALALAKATRALGRMPATQDEWNALVRDYNRLTSKRRGPLGEVIGQLVRERCPDPTSPDREPG